MSTSPVEPVPGAPHRPAYGAPPPVLQPVPASASVKTYTCPGCQGAIDPGVAHLVVWRADGVLGDAADLQARRHWHTACWRVA